MPVHLRLVARAAPYSGLLFANIVILAGSSLLVLSTPWLVGFAIDTGLDIVTETDAFGAETESVRGSMGTLSIAFALLIVASIARGAFVFAQTYLAERLSQSIAYDFRNDIYDHLQRLSYAYHDNAQIGQIMSRATQDVEGVRMFVSMGVIRFLYVIILVSVAYGLMIQANAKVGVIALIFVPIVAVTASVSSLMLRPIWMRVQDLQGQMSTVLQENLTGQRVVKAFSRTEFEQQKFDAKVDELFDESYRTAKFQAFNDPFMQSLWLISLAIVFWVSMGEVRAGNMAVGDLVAFQLYLTLLQVPVRTVGFIINTFARANSGGARIFEILDAESAVQEKPGAPEMDAQHGEVTFENVSFGYDSQSAAALLRRHGRRHQDRRRGHPRRDARLAARVDRHRPAGRVPLRRHHQGEHRLRASRSHRRGDPRGREGRAHPRLHRPDAGRVRDLGR
jgi:ATP-binding cassette subfamily B protein